ncbi:MAG TPA: hypothetical protein VKR81_15875 [Candidatus Binatia bacterium]|nr:hypothetical protein [Candidatus Binatia bacterium]
MSLRRLSPSVPHAGASGVLWTKRNPDRRNEGTVLRMPWMIPRTGNL